MKLNDGEFKCESIVKGNKTLIYGNVDYCKTEKKWIAKIEGKKFEGDGDCSMEAIIDVLKKWGDIK
jgi:hypothetical protein